METATPTPTTVTAEAVTLLDALMAETLEFTFAHAERFRAGLAEVRDACDDPIAREAIGVAGADIEGRVFDAGTGRMMFTVEQRVIDVLLDLRAVLAAGA